MSTISNNRQGKVTWLAVQKHRIVIDSEWNGYTATWDKENAGELRLYEDEQGRMWLNSVSVGDNLQYNGIGLSLLNQAVQEHREIYAAVGREPRDEINEGDTRHLSAEGSALVASAIRNGILKDEWCFNPAVGYGLDDEY